MKGRVSEIKKKIVLIGGIILLVFAGLVFGGLKNYRELNDLAIVSSISIDKEDNGEYLVSAQIVNSKKASSGEKSGGESTQIVVYKQRAKTISLALQNIIRESPKKLYTAHMDLLVINEEIAKEGIGNIIDFFLRDIETNKEFVILIAKGTRSEDVIRTLTPIETNPTKNLIDSFKAVLEYQGSAVNSLASNVLTLLLEPGIELTVSSVVVEGKGEDGEKKENIESAEPKTVVKINDIAYFEKEKLKGYLEGFDNTAYTILRSNLKSAVLEFEDDNSPIAYNVSGCGVKFKVEEQNEKFKIDFNVKVKGNVSEINNDNANKNSGDVPKIEKLISKQLGERLNQYVDNTKNKYNVDIMGIESLLGKYKYKEFNKVRNNFNYRDVDINVNVEATIENEGGIFKKW